MIGRKLGVTLLVLGISALFYAVERSMEHFLWHVGYGAAAGLFLAAATGWRPFPTALATYGYMVIPDLIWLSGKWFGTGPVAHAPWMDIFLGHYSLDKWSLATPLVLPTYLAGMLAVAWRAGNVMKRSQVAAA